MHYMSINKSAGFTLIEMLVVAPLVLLLIGAIIAYITVLTGQSLQVREKNVLAYNIQDSLDWIEGDGVKATKFLSTTGTLTSPQGKNDNTDAFTSTDSLVLASLATDKNPADPARQLVYYANQPSPCGPSQINNQLFVTDVVYFVKGGSLWRRTIVPPNNLNSPADGSTVCIAPWQQNSCTPGYTAALCKAEDSELMQHVSSLTVKYYANPSSTTELGSANAGSAMTIDITLAAQENVAGKSISRTGSLRITHLNNVDNN